MFKYICLLFFVALVAAEEATIETKPAMTSEIKPEMNIEMKPEMKSEDLKLPASTEELSKTDIKTETIELGKTFELLKDEGKPIEEKIEIKHEPMLLRSGLFEPMLKFFEPSTFAMPVVTELKAPTILNEYVEPMHHLKTVVPGFYGIHPRFMPALRTHYEPAEPVLKTKSIVPLGVQTVEKNNLHFERTPIGFSYGYEISHS